MEPVVGDREGENASDGAFLGEGTPGRGLDRVLGDIHQCGLRLLPGLLKGSKNGLGVVPLATAGVQKAAGGRGIFRGEPGDRPLEGGVETGVQKLCAGSDHFSVIAMSLGRGRLRAQKVDIALLRAVKAVPVCTLQGLSLFTERAAADRTAE